MIARPPLGIRWTIGRVSRRGFDALRLSVEGAWRLFGPDAAYTVCVNSVPLDDARALTGEVPGAVQWRAVDRSDLPSFLRPHLAADMAEGMGWKFAPLRCFSSRYELSLDNDCVLWRVPPAMQAWFDGAPSGRLMAEDVRAAFGQFASFCGDGPRNLGIRGIGPAVDLAADMRATLAANPVLLVSELDEQGLQVASLIRGEPVHVVSLDDVTVCSPFHPLRPDLGRCGAHFVGLNSHTIPWNYFERPALECLHQHWDTLRPMIEQRIVRDVRRFSASEAGVPRRLVR